MIIGNIFVWTRKSSVQKKHSMQVFLVINKIRFMEKLSKMLLKKPVKVIRLDILKKKLGGILMVTVLLEIVNFSDKIRPC